MGEFIDLFVYFISQMIYFIQISIFCTQIRLSHRTKLPKKELMRLKTSKACNFSETSAKKLPFSVHWKDAF